MSWFTSMRRVWLGIALVLFFGVPILSVLSWIVGGVFGFVLLVVGAAFVFFVLWSEKL